MQIKKRQQKAQTFRSEENLQKQKTSFLLHTNKYRYEMYTITYTVVEVRRCILIQTLPIYPKTLST